MGPSWTCLPPAGQKKSKNSSELNNRVYLNGKQPCLFDIAVLDISREFFKGCRRKDSNEKRSFRRVKKSKNQLGREM